MSTPESFEQVIRDHPELWRWFQEGKAALPWIFEPLNLDAAQEKEIFARRVLAAERLRARLCCVPFYAKRAAREQAESGDDLLYWMVLLGRVDDSPETSSTAARA